MRYEIDRPHWSYSALAQYLRCPLQFYFERVVRRPRTTIAHAQALGSAVHAALAEYHRTLLAKADVVPRHVRDRFLAAWDELEATSKIIHTDGSFREETVEAGIALVETYLRELPPQGILAVEEPILVPITTSAGLVLEKPLLVVPDLVTAPDDRTIQVHEIKTSGRAHSESEAATSLQPTCYAHAVHETTGTEPIIEFTVLVKTRTPRIQRIEAVRSVPDFLRLGDLVQAVERAVDVGIFYPQESPLNCSGCPYYRPCREWSASANHDASGDGFGSPAEALAC